MGKKNIFKKIEESLNIKKTTVDKETEPLQSNLETKSEVTLDTIKKGRTLDNFRAKLHEKRQRALNAQPKSQFQ